MSNSKQKQRLTIVLTMALLALSNFAATRSAIAQASDATGQDARAFESPAGPLGTALGLIADTFLVTVMASDDLVAGKTAPTVSGVMSADEAVDRVLRGSDLDARRSSSGAIVIARAATQRQDAQASGTAAPSDEDAEPIEEFIVRGRVLRSTGTTGVTALDAPLDELPFSITVIDTDEFRLRGGTRIEDLGVFVPGLAVTTSSGQTGDALIIRGFQTSQTLYNGLPRYSFSESWQPLAIMDRVEILKGAAGVESGVIGPGGSVNFVTKKPEATAARDIEVRFGSFSRIEAVADFTGPLGSADNWFYRLVASIDQGDSYRDNYGPEQYVIAPSIEYRYGDGGSLLFELGFNRNDTPYDRGVFYLEGAGLEDNFADIEFSKHEPDDMLESDTYRAAVYWRQPLTPVWSVNASVEAQLGDFLSLGARNPNLNGLYDGGPNNSLTFSGDSTIRRSFTRFDGVKLDNVGGQIEAAARFSTGDVDHQAAFGFQSVRFDRQSFGQDGQTTWDLDAFAPLYGTAPTVIGDAGDGVGRDFDSVQTDDYRSVYGQYKLDIGAWHLVGGVRWDDFESESQFTRNVNVDPPGPIDRLEDDNVSFRIGGVFDLTGSLSLYATYDNAFVPQSGQLASGAAIDALEGLNNEIGMRWTSADGLFSVDASLFELTQSNVPQEDPDDPLFVVLTGEVRSRGLEVAFSGRATRNWALDGSLTLLSAEITDNPEDPSIEGNDRFNVPDVSASLFSRLSLAALGLPQIRWDLGLMYVGERPGEDRNRFDLPSYVRVDTGLVAELEGDLRLNLYVENLFDERYFQAAQNRATIVYPGAPQTLTIALRKQF